jgi:YD repeat-containing protein
VGSPGPSPRAAETTQYTYDALGRVVSAIDQSGKKVAYTYDSAGNRTRVSNGAEFAEIIPTALSASSNAGTTGLTTANGMRDGVFNTLSSIHATNVETGAWVKADLGSVQNVNHIVVAAAIEGTIGVSLGDLNDTAVEYSVDGTIWNPAAAIEGVAPGATRSISLGGVALRYLRIRRPLSGRVALGDLRLYSAASANTPLIANPDTITSTGSAVTFDPRLNDQDLDGNAIAISGVDQPPHGTAVINASASITYTPAAGYFGADSFLYSVTDGHNGAASARVSVIVQSSTNHAPVAVNDQFSISDRATAVVDGVNSLRPLNNDYDADGDVLTITGTSTPAHGALSVIGANLVQYQPAVGYSGSDSFTYTISDGRGGTATATVTVSSSNTNPIAAQDNVTTSRGVAVTLDPRLNDSDPNGDPISITSITAPANGTATLNADQTVTYAPNTGFVGGDGLTYALSDGRGGTATGRISIEVTPNAPPIAVGDNISASASTPVTFDPRSNDSDPENRPLTIVALTAPSHGTAVMANAGTAVTYTAAAGYSGPDNFTYAISDDQGATASALVAVNAVSVDYLAVGGGGGGGGPWNGGGGGGGGGVLQGSTAMAVGSIAITVGSGGASGTYPGQSGAASSIGSTITAIGGGGGGADVPPHGGQNGGSGGGAGANYSTGGTSGAGTIGQGYKGGDNTIPRVSGGGGGAGGPGQSSVNTSRAGAGGPGITSSISGSPITYAAGGGGGGFTDGGSYYVAAGAGTGLTPASNTGSGGRGVTTDTVNGDIPGSAGASGVVILRYPGAPKATGGTITQIGGFTIHTFTTAGTFNVTSTNTGPTAVNDSIVVASGAPYSFDPRANDTDPNGDSLSIIAIGPASHGAIVQGAFGAPVTYTPTLGYTGSDSFTYTVSDGQGLTSTATVTVTVTGGYSIDYLVVGGGGGGGNTIAGGGGGGALRTGSFFIASGPHSITVGAGGSGAANRNTRPANGGSSGIDTIITAPGGGGGASNATSALSTGANGGGGSGGIYPGGGGSSSGGYAGGTSAGRGAGGGGAGAAGVNSTGSAGGAGGIGLSNSLSGAATTYAAGGGGGGFYYTGANSIYNPNGPAGDASAGAGGYSGAGAAAPANRGGGGGGGGQYVDDSGYTDANGGLGGSGVVVIRYATGTMTATGGTITTSGGYTIHTFTSSGTFTVP